MVLGAVFGGAIRAFAPTMARNFAVNFFASFFANVLSDRLNGASHAGGAEGIGRRMQHHQPNDLCNATINVINAVHVDAAKQALNRLCDELNMPKFLRDAIHKEFDKVLQQSYQACNPATQNDLNACVEKDVKNQVKNLADQFRKYVDDILKERFGDETAGVGGGGAKRKMSAKSWIAVIAEALGKAQGQHAKKMLDLSAKVSNIAEKQAQFEDDNKGLDVKDEKAKHSYDSEKSKLGAEMTKAQTELQAVSQEFKLISETTSTLLKNLGEALSGMARKQ